MHLYTTLRETICAALPELAEQPFDFQPTPDNQPGDIGLPCFRFAGSMRMKPVEVAKKIVVLDYPEIITTAQAVGPYVNFTLDRTVFAATVLNEVYERDASFGSDGSGTGVKVLLEHTSINPNASPHIGRARNGLIGDTLARMLRFEGYDVDVHYYVNDMGKQIGLLALQADDIGSLAFDDVLDLYVEANRRAEHDPAFEQKGFGLLMKMEAGDDGVKRTFTRLVDICLEGQLQVLGRLNLSYDTFDRESTFLHDPRMDEVIAMLREKGALFTDEDGRTVADLSKIGWEREEGRYIVLLRANGSSMYMYRDIAYTLEKIERAEDHNFIVLGEDHKMYFEQLALIVAALGKKPPEPIHYSYILLKAGKMSTRKGTVVLLSDFLDEAISRAREKVDGQWPDLPDTERGNIARIIGIGAVRFAILSVRPNKNVVFDWDSALNFNGDSGPYVQYSCTRISSILRKHGESAGTPPERPSVIHDAEWALVTRLALVESDIAFALRERNPGVLAGTALDIARLFSVFYNACPVLAADTDESRDTRVALCVAVRQTLVNLLGLLGIEAPERM